jgi:hypothetical protein
MATCRGSVRFQLRSMGEISTGSHISGNATHRDLANLGRLTISLLWMMTFPLPCHSLSFKNL